MVRTAAESEQVMSARRGYRERAEELLFDMQSPFAHEMMVDVLAHLLAFGDAQGWYYGDLEPLAPRDVRWREGASDPFRPAPGYMRQTWALLGELVGLGLLEVAFLVRYSRGAQSAGFDRPDGESRREMLQANGGAHTDRQWEDLKERQGHYCLCCRRTEPEVELTKDHVIPVFWGGPDSPDNLQVLCRSCNTAKGIHIADYRPAVPPSETAGDED
jgi:hypothetical protein